MAKKKQQTEQAPARRRRRGIDEQIAALEAKIASIKDREARKKAKADPMLRHAAAAVRSIDKALAATKDVEHKKTLGQLRSSLATLVGNAAQSEEGGRVRRSAVEIEDLADTLLNYVRTNPGQRSEEIAAALAVDTGAIRPVMKRLISAGKVTTEGQRRGMTYSAV